MKKIILLLFCIMISCNEKQKIKIACVGDSITFGAGMKNRENNAYPKQLQNMLGNNYEVKNFGINGRTLLEKGDKPYIKTDIYKKALAYNSDYIFILLGTNDSKFQNRKYFENFEKDYENLIQSFQNKNPNSKIILLLPPPSFSKDSLQIFNPIIEKEILPRIKNVAQKKQLDLINCNAIFFNKEILFPDKIHPSSVGAGFISREIYKNIYKNKKINFTIIPQSGNEYRSQAGWQKGKGWWFQKNEIENLCEKNKNIDLLFLGNSITQSFGGKRKYVTFKSGQKILNEKFKDLKYINAGISGDKIEHLLYRLKNGNHEKTNPKYISLAIGVNN